MKWIQEGEWGRFKLATKQKYPGTVEVSSIKNTDQTESLERLDPNQAERVLGIRLLLTGEMKYEFEYRRSQLLQFGQKLYKSPLTHKEVHSAYQSRYKSIATYPYTITTFTTSELNQIQKKPIYLLLPKLGMNRHMPRAVIFGPKQLGGREIMDLRLEQPAKNFITTVGHMRRGDKVADALRATLNDLQIEIGREKPFFELDPEQHPYVTQNTRWLYTWKMAIEFDISIKVYQHWVPPTSYQHDQNIMQKAIMDKAYQGKNKYKLQTINLCRLYQQAFYIGDLAAPDGLTIKKQYLDGTEQHKHPSVTFPTMFKPTKLQWNEWKYFIFGTFFEERTTSALQLANQSNLNKQTKTWI